MNKKLIAIGIMLVFLMVGLCGCNEMTSRVHPDREYFIGTWIDKISHDQFTLDDNGRCYALQYDFGSWSLDGDILTFTSKDDGTKLEKRYVIINENEVQLTPLGSTMNIIYTRQI